MKIIKIPFSQGCLDKNLGCEKAPDKIINVLKNEFWLNEDYKKLQFNVDEVKIVKNNIKESLEKIYNKAKESFNDKVIFIGGDHSITFATFKAFSEKFDNAGLLIFDAHPDLEISQNIVTHEDYVYSLIKNNILKKENLILVGLRSFSDNEIYFLKNNKIKFFSMKQIFNNIEDSCDTIMELVRDFDSLYISIDIDILDPSYAPATGYLEPGGISSRELIYILQRLKLLKNIKAMDIVEVNPEKDINNMTIKLAAKLITEFF